MSVNADYDNGAGLRDAPRRRTQALAEVPLLSNNINVVSAAMTLCDDYAVAYCKGKEGDEEGAMQEMRNMDMNRIKFLNYGPRGIGPRREIWLVKRSLVALVVDLR